MAESKRLGVIVASVNIVVEQWYPAVAPDGVSFHFTRLLMPAGTSPDRNLAMDRNDGARAILQLASCRLGAIAYGWTNPSVVQGRAFDAQLRAEMRRTLEIPATTVTDSIFTACRAFGLKRVTMISPYVTPIGDAERRFFGQGGVEAIGSGDLGVTDGFHLGKITGEEIFDLAARAWNPASDGMIVACLNLRSHLAIEAIEAHIGKPVVTATQAVLWNLLRLAGIATPIAGYGRLLREH